MDRIDRLLAEDQLVHPSSGFSARVMEAVRVEAAMPPLEFPWRRLLAGLCALLAVAVVSFVTIAQSGGAGLGIGSAQELLDALASPSGRGLVIAVLAILGSLVTVVWVLRGGDGTRSYGTF